MTTPINNTSDIIDSRDVIERIAELEQARDIADLDDDETEELAALVAFAEAGSSVEDWEYGAGFVRDSYFEEYARELADDIGAIDANASWPLSCIDWEQAARELRMDYTAVEFDGVTYWVR